MDRFKIIQETLKQFNQSHLLTFWEKLSESQQDQLLDDLERVNFEEISLAAEKLSSSDHPERNRIEPVTYEVLEDIPEIKRIGYEQKGMKIIKKGEVAVVLLAGG